MPQAAPWTDVGAAERGGWISGKDFRQALECGVVAAEAHLAVHAAKAGFHGSGRWNFVFSAAMVIGTAHGFKLVDNSFPSIIMPVEPRLPAAEGDQDGEHDAGGDHCQAPVARRKASTRKAAGAEMALYPVLTHNLIRQSV